MNLFKIILREEAKEKKSEKPYRCGDFEVKRNTITDEISVYNREIYSSDMYKKIIKAVNIENEDDVLWYKIINLPGGRVAFGGFLDNYNVEENIFYSFTDTCYKLLGKTLDSDAKLSKNDILRIKERFQERIGKAKYNSLYEINYKKQYVGERVFEGRKYFVTYSNGDEYVLESFGDESPIKLDYDIIYSRKDNPFQIKVIAELGRSRLFHKCKYTRQTLTQIIKKHEKAINQGQQSPR